MQKISLTNLSIFVFLTLHLQLLQCGKIIISNNRKDGTPIQVIVTHSGCYKTRYFSPNAKDKAKVGISNACVLDEKHNPNNDMARKIERKSSVIFDTNESSLLDAVPFFSKVAEGVTVIVYDPNVKKYFKRSNVKLEINDRDKPSAGVVYDPLDLGTFGTDEDKQWVEFTPKTTTKD